MGHVTVRRWSRHHSAPQRTDALERACRMRARIRRAGSEVDGLEMHTSLLTGSRLAAKSASDGRYSVRPWLLLGVFFTAVAFAQNDSIPRNAAPDVAYVGSEACAGCHRQIFDRYRTSAMGRSMAVAGEDAARLIAGAAPVVSERLNRRFVVERQHDGIYQRETEAHPSDQPPFDNAHKLAYVIGSGVNGFSFLVRRGQYLVQAPVSYYQRKRAWGLSPGYEFAKPGEDYGFNRTIHAACLQCHAGRPLPVKGYEGRYEDPPFEELAIGCENCHGAGQLHVDAKFADLAAEDRAIVNPVKLPPRLAENICMNCHQGGDSRILQKGRGHFDFRPGTWLNNTVSILKLPMDPNNPKESDLLEHNASMELSRCFLATGGELNCFSCHEIHKQPAEAQRAAYYRSKCLQCHEDSACVLESRLRPGNDCARCHMPKRDVAEISHSSLTNHRIIRRAGQPYPSEAFSRAPADLPELVHVNRPPGAGAESLPLLVRFQAFGELLSRRPDFSDRYLALLGEAAERHGDDPLVLAALGRKAKLEKRAPEAIEYLGQAVEAGFQPASTYEDLAQLLMEAGRLEESADILKRGVAALPYNPRLLKMLALRHIKLEQYRDALAAIQRFVELFPEDDFMRGLLRQVQGLPTPP